MRTAEIPLVFDKNDFVKVPVGFEKFPMELPTPPNLYIKKGFNIQDWTEIPAGRPFCRNGAGKLVSKKTFSIFYDIIIMIIVWFLNPGTAFHLLI